MPCVVVAGGGFAGLSAARELQRRRRQADDLEIVLVDRNNFTLFTPLLPEVASGGVAPRDVVQTFRELLPGARCELGEVIEIDAGSRRVRVRHPLTAEVRELPYDELILALGSTPSSHGVAGVAEHTLPLHSVDDAVRIRNAVIGAFEVAARTQDLIERDRLLRFVVVGGGFTGVESVGELSAFARSIARYYPKRAAQFVLVHDGGRLLSHLPPRFGKYAARSLSDRGVHLIFDRKVASVDDLGIKLDDGRRLESRTIVWSAGSEANPLARRLGLRTEHGAIVTGRDGAVAGCKHLWAIGDCSAFAKRHGGYYAPLAQNAVREGPLVARNVLATLRGRRTKAFSYREMGRAAALGDRRAVVELPGGAMATGLAAWLMWRGYYLSRVPGTRARARVALDWALGLAFPPSNARLAGDPKGR